MKENLATLFGYTENALSELKNNSIPFLSIETATSWVRRYKNLKYETIILDFSCDYKNDFSSIFYLLENMTKLAAKKSEIFDCITDFKKTKKTFDDLLIFLNTYEDLLSTYNLPELVIVDEKYYALARFEYLKFKKEELKELMYVNENIDKIYRRFYSVKQYVKEHTYLTDKTYLEVLDEIINEMNNGNNV